jgi:PAS domain S-box-containing protein
LLAQVLARIPRAVFWRDRNGVYLGCNEPFARFVGASNPEEVIGRRDADLPRGSELGIWLAQYNRDVLEEGRAVLDVEQELRAEDGREVILLFSRVPLRDAAGAISGVLGTFADVTKTRRTTEELRQARQELQLRVAERTDELAHRNLVEEQRRVQSILDNTTAVVYVKNSEGRYILVNSQFTRIFHLSPEDILGKTDAEIFPADMAARFRANDLQVQAERRAIQFEEVAPHDDGPHHYISVKFPLEDAPDRPCAVCGISTDITERIVSEERLKREEQLLRRLLELREREQMLLAYEIHDGLVHYIVGAKMILEGHGGDRTEGAKLDAGGYQEVLRLLVEAIDDGRRLISELRPPILDEEGIIGAIEYLAAEHLQKSGRTVRFIHDVDFDRLSPLLEQTIFRIVQEALNNFVRHSAASQAQVKLQQSGRTVRLEIQDSGVGFNPAQVSPDRFGLRGIVERSRLFGGNATINSRPGGGTSVVVEIPMDQPVSP